MGQNVDSEASLDDGTYRMIDEWKIENRRKLKLFITNYTLENCSDCTLSGDSESCPLNIYNPARNPFLPKGCLEKGLEVKNSSQLGIDHSFSVEQIREPMSPEQIRQKVQAASTYRLRAED